MNTATMFHSSGILKHTLQRIEPDLMPGLIFEHSLRDCYFANSKFFQLKGGFEAEVIHKPGYKFLNGNMIGRVVEELGPVLLAAFGKEDIDSDKFLSGNRFTRVAVWVDWLVVVRKNRRPVAFSSASMIPPFLMYLNAAMVLPEFQVTGVGLVASALLWKTAVEETRKKVMLEPDIVCRTHNRNVASVLLHLLKDAKLSTEALDLNSKRTFAKVAKYLGCGYDEASGVSRNVYPDELPNGSKTNNVRINEAFEKIGPQDACYVIGRLDELYTEKLLARHVQGSSVEESIRNLATVTHSLN